MIPALVLVTELMTRLGVANGKDTLRAFLEAAHAALTPGATLAKSTLVDTMSALEKFTKSKKITSRDSQRQ